MQSQQNDQRLGDEPGRGEVSGGRVAFVTGGTGFIGSHLVERLLEVGYREVRCLVRDRPKWLEGRPVTFVRGTLREPETYRDALSGVTHVYHVAGVTRAKRYGELYAANALATRALCCELLPHRHRLRGVLLASSLSAVGTASVPVPDESYPTRPVSNYGRSKAAMERLVSMPLGDDGRSLRSLLGAVIVRPPAVYGPRDRDIYAAIRGAGGGILPVPGSLRRPSLSLVHVSDLVSGMQMAAESRAARGATLFLDGPAHYSWLGVRRALQRALKRRILAVSVPRAVLPVAGALSEIGGLIGGDYPAFNIDKAREMYRAVTMCSDRRARELVGYRANVPLAVGMEETVRWYRAAGWL